MLKEICGYDESKYDLYRKEKWEKIRKSFFQIIIWMLAILLVIFLAYLINSTCFLKTRVINDSMEPTLSKNDKILVNVISYKMFSPDRYDICILKRGDEEHLLYDTKRIYGLPGETVQISNGIIYIDGKELEEKFNVSEMKISGIAIEPIKLGKDEYFVLADDRSKEDSRFAGYGKVSKDDIIGKAFLRTNEFGFVGMFNKK